MRGWPGKGSEEVIEIQFEKEERNRRAKIVEGMQGVRVRASVRLRVFVRHTRWVSGSVCARWTADAFNPPRATGLV